MGKADQLKKVAGNISESIGAGAATAARPLPPRRAPDPRQVGTSRSQKSFEIELAQLVPDPDQPRKEFDAVGLEKLAKSIKRRGQLMPVLARFSTSLGKWMIVDGERRYRAAVIAELAVIQVQESTKTDSGEIFLDQIVANLQREDLKPLEKANAYAQLIEQNGWDGVRLAEELEVSPGQVSQILALLSLPEEVQARVDEGAISSTAAYEVSRIRDPKVQGEVVERILEAHESGEAMTREEVRAEVRTAVAQERPARSSASGAPTRSPGRQPKVDQSWKDKVDGYSIEVIKKRGFNRSEAAAALRRAAEKLDGAPSF